MKILIVEDDEITLKALEYRLKLDGHQVIVARDGRYGKKYLLNEKPDIIISDILMPHISGIELLSLVRNELKLDTPFIIITVLGQQNNFSKAMTLGATDYMIKPLDPVELIAKIKKFEKCKKAHS